MRYARPTVGPVPGRVGVPPRRVQRFADWRRLSLAAPDPREFAGGHRTRDRLADDRRRHSHGMAVADGDLLPPLYIARTQWVQTEVGPSLQVYPTDAGRQVTEPGAQDTAWREVVAKSSPYGQYSASSPGMRAQFDCHWVWARAVAPDKPSWNLEPGRPVVDENEMVSARCNPGAPEE